MERSTEGVEAPTEERMTVETIPQPNEKPLSEQLFARAMAEAARLNEHPSMKGGARAQESELWHMGLHARYYEGMIEYLTLRLEEVTGEV